MHRRNFILQSALLSAGSLIMPWSGAGMPAKKYKMGLQLFTVNDLLSKDMSSTIKRIAAIGYEDCETYGYNPEQRTYYGLKAASFKQLLGNNGLITTSGHYDFTNFFDKPTDDLLRFVDQCIEGAQVLNQRYITWPWLAPSFRTLEHFRRHVRRCAGDAFTAGPEHGRRALA